MAGTSENIQAQMRKGFLEYCILLILERQPSYANEIIEELKEAKLIVVEGTLYPLLTRLKNSGLLTYTWAESTQGPPRKYYTLTEEGQEILKVLEKSWEEINGVVECVKKRERRETK